MGRILFFILFGAVAVVSFQNCGPSGSKLVFSEASSSKAASEDSDGGAQPYDGKIYVVLGPSCGDGTKIHSKIVVRNPDNGSLVRENCQDITPVALSGNDFNVDPLDSEKLTYKNQTFTGASIFTLSAINFSNAPTTVTYSYTFTGPVVLHQLFLDTDVNGSTGYTGRAGLGADYFLENGILYVYSGSNGLWGWTPLKNKLTVINGSNVTINFSKSDVGTPSAVRSVVTIGDDTNGATSPVSTQSY